MAFNNKVSRLQFIVTTVATLDSYTCIPDALVLDGLEDAIPKTKRSLFGIKPFIKQLKKEGKFICIFVDKSNQKDIANDEVGLTNGVLVWLSTHHKKIHW